MDECLITLCLKRLLDISRLTTVSVKLFLYMPQLANEIEQIGMQLMTVIHSWPAGRFTKPPARSSNAIAHRVVRRFPQKLRQYG